MKGVSKMRELYRLELIRDRQTCEVINDEIHVVPIDSVFEKDSVIDHVEFRYFCQNPICGRWEEISEAEYNQAYAENLREIACQHDEEKQIIQTLSPSEYSVAIPAYETDVVTVQEKSVPSVFLHDQSITFNVHSVPSVLERDVPNKTDNNLVGIDGNFRMRILAQCNYIEGDDISVKYKFLLQFSQMEQKVLVSSSDVCAPQWVEHFTHGKAYLNPGKKAAQAFARYIHELLLVPNLPQINTFMESGWKKIGNSHVYVHAGGAIGDLPDNMEVYGNPEFHINFRSNMLGNRKIFQMTLQVLEITRDQSIMSTIFTFLHTAVLTSLYLEAGYPVKFLLALLGLTNSKKTSLALATLRIFNTQNPSPDITFSSTPGGIEIALSRYNDAVLIIDDCMPATNRSRQNSIDGKFDDIARAIGDRTPKKRMYSFCSNGEKAKEYVSKCCGAITGEQLRGVQSALARTVQLEIKRDDVINKRLQFFQENYDVIPTHMVDFLGYISSNYTQIVQFIKNTLPSRRDLIETKIPRFADSFAVLTTTVEIIGRYICERQFLNDYQIEKLKKKFNMDIKEVVLRNDKKLFIQEPGSIILDALENARIEKIIPFFPRSQYEAIGNVILYDNNIIYARAETLLQITQKYCHTFGVPIALIDKKAVITALEHIGVLDCSSERARKLPKNDIDGRRYLYIKKDKMNEILTKTDKEVS